MNAFSLRFDMDIRLLVVTLCFVLASAQFKINGSCPDFSKCRDSSVKLTKEKLEGIWFLESSIPYFFQLNQKCTQFNITALQETTAMQFDKIEYDVT